MISFEIKKRIKVLATYESGWTKELNLVSWNEAEPKFDIRDWSEDHTHMSRGVTLTYGELNELRKGLMCVDTKGGANNVL